ncbi:MAG TPA: polysaccharide biosynthesis C-terminal domain-containing protein [Tepidisphaeraceae bacterium]|jgi:O-antigen/teichoic acid export membrane protein
MHKGSHNVVRHAAAYLLARGVPGIISFLAIPLFTRLLDPDGYGNYTLVTTTAGLINALAFQWLRLSFVRYLPAAKGEPRKLKSTLLTCQLLLVAVGALIVAGVWVIPAAHAWRAVAGVCWLVTAVQPTFELFCEEARASIRPRYYMMLQLSRAVLTTGLGAGLILLGLGWWGPLLGMAAGNFLPGLYAFGRGWRGTRLSIDLPTLAMVCRYGIPLSLTVALAIVISSSDRYLIAGFLGTGPAGIYAAAVDFTSQTLTLLMMSISLAILPLAIRAYEHQGPEAARAQMRHNASLLLAVGVPAVVGLALLAGNISHCFLGKEFRAEAARIIPIIALGTFLAGYKAYHLDSAFQFAHRTIHQVWIVLIAAAINVVLNLVMIRPFGVIGAAGASVIAYLISMVLTAAYGRRHFALPFPMKDFARILAGSAAMAAVLLALRGQRGAVALAAQVILGGGVYAAVMACLNFHDARTFVSRRLGWQGRGATPATGVVEGVTATAS